MEIKFDIENPLTNFNDNDNTNNNKTSTTNVSDLFHLESDHMVSEIYTKRLKSSDFSLSLRRETVSLILQFSGSFDPFLSGLAINYLDRFFSNQGMPMQAKPWATRLLAMTCVSLASKMMKTEFSLSDVQDDDGFIFDSQTIERMETLILGALNWRMRSIIPFAFLHYFTTFFKLKDPPLMQALKDRALEIIFKSQNEIKLLEFKPSIVAATALLSASHELFPIHFPCFLKSINPNCPYVNKEQLAVCMNVMEEILSEGYETTTLEGVVHKCFLISSSTNTAVNVLDQQWSCSFSDNNHTQTTNNKRVKITDESGHHQEINIDEEERGSKRQRKQIIGTNATNVSSSSSSLTFQLSQLQQC